MKNALFIGVTALTTIALAADGGITLPPSIIPTGQSVLLSFSNPTNRSQLEQSIAIFAGDVTSSTPSPNQPLTLTNICDGRWQIHNPNTSNVAFRWQAKKNQAGLGVVGTKQAATFQTNTGPGSVRILIGKTQLAKTNTSKPCTTQLHKYVWNEDSTMVRITPTSPLRLGAMHSLVLPSNSHSDQGIKPNAIYNKVFVARKNMLEPGGRYVSPDGVIVEAQPGSLDAPVEINIERIRDDEPGLIPLNNDVIPLGQTYRINLGRAIRSPNDAYFKISFPIPQEAISWLQNIDIYELLPNANEVTDRDESGPFWIGSGAVIQEPQRIARLDVGGIRQTSIFKFARVRR